MSISAKITALLLTGTLLLGAFFRLWGIREQGFFFYDEGAQIYRADFIQTQLTLPFTGQDINPTTYEMKPLWLGLIVLGQSLFHGFFGVQVVSAFFGILTIALCFLFSREIGQPRPTALLSALLLALFSYHIFYSRLAMPETAAGFGSLLAFYFYIKSLHTGRNRYAFFAGLTLAVFYFINYRIILVPFDLALLQFILCIKQKQWKPGVKRLAIFALPLLLALPVYEIFLAVLRILQIANISPYLSTFSGTAVAGQYPDISSLLTTPYVLMTTEGAPFVALIFAGCWAARKNTILGWIVLIIALQLLAGVISAEKAFRIVSPLLALVAILAAAGFGTLAEGLRPNRWLRFVPVILLLLSVWQSLLHAVEGLKFRSEMPQAVALVKNRFGEAPILTSNRPLTRLYAYPRFLRTVRNEQVADLKQFADEGYGALILDPQKYILSTASLNWNDPQLSPLVNAVSSKCTPVIIFRHYPPRLLKFFLFEHIGPTLAHTLRLLDTLDETSG